MSLDPRELVTRATRWALAHPDERDPWEKAPAITGVLAWNDPESVQGVKRWIDRAVDTQGSDGYLCYSERIDLPHGHVRTFTPTGTLSASIGYPMLELYQRDRDARYLEAARLQVEAILRAPRTKDGGISCRHESNELWVDFIYLMAPFLARYGKVSGEQQHVDEAFAQYQIQASHLIDPFTGLARHAWCETPNHFPQSTLWARGNGWLVCAAVDLLEIEPNHPRATYLADTCKAALEAMRSLQDRSGFLRHILDDPFSKFEASATVMFAYAAARAAERGLVDGSFVDSALRGWRAVALSIGDDGAVPGVAVPPGGPGVPFGSTLFGQGFFLLATHALRKQLNA
jgi:unsaturated rhamnogalacturonyl hydrolase